MDLADSVFERLFFRSVNVVEDILIETLILLGKKGIDSEMGIEGSKLVLLI